MKRLNILALLSFILFLSCKKEEEIETYSISGRVLTESGVGIPNVKVYLSKHEYILSDKNGSWETSSIAGGITIIPEKVQYTFTPESQTANVANHSLIFEGKRESSANEVMVLNWLESLQLNNGLLESAENGNVVSLYDNALAAMVFTINGDYNRAENIFDFFNARIESELKNGKGGFSQFRDRNGIPNYQRWLGDNAWMLIALNNYQDLTGSNTYDVLIQEMENWITNLQDVDGGLWGGFDVSGDRIHKITEGQLDAFCAVRGYSLFHENVLKYLSDNRWDDKDLNLVAWPSNPKYLYALDLHAWGYSLFEDYPLSSLYSANRFYNQQIATANNSVINGYCFDEDRDVVWLEGNGQMAVAFNEAGLIQQSQELIVELNKLVLPSIAFPGTSGIPYSSNFGSSYGNSPLWPGADTQPCISSSAWYLFACLDFNPLGQGRNKAIPLEHKFWIE